MAQTLSQICSRLRLVHGGAVEIVPETYKTTRQKATFIDKEFGQWEALVSDVLMGHGHPRRGVLRRARLQALSLKEVQSRLKEVHGDAVEIVPETYKTANQKAIFIDKEFGQWKTVVDSVLRGTGHPRRGALKIAKSQTLSLDKVQSRLKEVHGDTVQIVPETYKTTRQKATFIDKEFGQWEAAVCDVFAGGVHPKRSSLKRTKLQTLPLKEVQSRLKEVHGDAVEIVPETYKRVGQKATFIDKEFGQWEAIVYNVLQGSSHPRRGILKRAKLKTVLLGQIQDRLKEAHGDIVEVSPDTYSGTSKKATFIDKEFGPWEALVSNVLAGSSHPRRYGSLSKNEEKIGLWLKDLGIMIDTRKKFNFGNKTLECDIFIPPHNLGIEYNGLYWHSAEHKAKKYHYDKRDLFAQKGVTLYQIYSDEWEQKPEIVKSIILAKLGLLNSQHYARNLTIKEVPNKYAQEFLRQNHLMGEHRTAKHLGLYTKDNELVSLLGYKKHKDGIDISRFCNKINTSIVGGLSRLLKEVERLNPEVKYIQSWVDLRYGTGNSLLKLGFKHVKTTLGWKWTDGINTYNRLRCRANMDKRKLTEREYANELGWYRIYDAGQALFVKKTF